MPDVPANRPPAILVPPSKRGRKRAPKPRKNAPASADRVTQAEGAGMALTELELLRLRLFAAEHRRFNAEASMRVLEKQALVRQLDPDNKLGLLDQAIRAASEGAARAQGQHNETLLGIEKRLNIEIKNFSFDAETGRLFPHQADTTEAPTE